MHASYFLLIDFEDVVATAAERAEDPDVDDTPNLIMNATSAMEDYYRQGGCDENNWYQEEVLVMRDGRVFQMCPKDDWRGRHEAFNMYERLPQDERWDAVMLFAAQCAAYECGIEREFPEGTTVNDVMAAVMKEVPVRLSQDYNSIIGTTRDQVEKRGTEGWLAEYRRGKIAIAFENLRRAYVPPFSYPTHPSDARCFDMTGETGIKDTMGILIVDIHT